MPRRRLAAPRVRCAQAAALLAALLGMAAPAAAQVPAAPSGPALDSTSASPAVPGAPSTPAGAPSTPAGAPSTPAGAPPAPASGALVPVPQGYYLPPPSLPPWANPRTIQYEEGDPIPRGYALRTRPDRTLLGAGLLTFGVPYAISFTVAGIATLAEEDFDEFGPLFIPFVGPMIGTATMDVEGAGLFWLTMDSVLQVSGLLLYAAGFAHEEVYLERQFSVSPRGPEHAASMWPAISIGPSSAELRWRF